LLLIIIFVRFIVNLILISKIFIDEMKFYLQVSVTIKIIHISEVLLMPIQEMLAHNKRFVEQKQYIRYETDSFPNKKMVVLTCMESRLVELLPRALNIQNGDVKMLKNAGAVINRPFGNIMKSILIAIHNLRAEHVVVIGHHDCGMTKIKPNEFIQNMYKNGIKEETVAFLERSGISIEEEFRGFKTVEQSIQQSVSIIKNHPLLPKYVNVYGLVMDPATGKVTLLSHRD